MGLRAAARPHTELLPTPHEPRSRRHLNACRTLPVVTLAAAGSVLACDRTGKAAATSRPNVLLLSIDSLRGDLLDPGPGDPVAPRMAGLRDQGVWFSQATAAAPWTTP